MNNSAERVLERTRRKRDLTQVITVREYYPEDTDVDAEIFRLIELPKTEENILRLENLKRIRTIRRWSGKWFVNDARIDCKQYVRHTNWKFYWPWNPETVIVDTTFVDVYKDGNVEVKVFQGHPFLIDHAESHYSEVVGKITLNRIEKWINNPSETIRFDRLM